MNNAFSPFVPLSILSDADPAHGDRWIYHIPDNHVWILIGFSCSVSTDASVADRYPYFSYLNTIGQPILTSGPHDAIKANQSAFISIANYGSSYSNSNTELYTLTFPDQLQLAPLTYVSFALFAMEVNDQISKPTLLYFDIPFDMTN